MKVFRKSNVTPRIHKPWPAVGIRPSIYGVILILCITGAWLAVLAFDHRSLARIASALSAILVLSIFVGIGQICVVCVKKLLPAKSYMLYRAMRIETVVHKLAHDGSVLSAHYVCDIAERGHYQYAWQNLVWYDPLSIWRIRVTKKLHGDFAFVPQAISESWTLTKQAQLGSADSQYTLTVRDYVPGDAPRDIAWKASARQQRLLVRERERQASSPCMIIPVLPSYDEYVQSVAAQENKGTSLSHAYDMSDLRKLSDSESGAQTVASHISRFQKVQQSIIAATRTLLEKQADSTLAAGSMRIQEKDEQLLALGALEPSNILETLETIQQWQIHSHTQLIIIIAPSSRLQTAYARAEQVAQKCRDKLASQGITAIRIVQVDDCDEQYQQVVLERCAVTAAATDRQQADKRAQESCRSQKPTVALVIGRSLVLVCIIVGLLYRYSYLAQGGIWQYSAIVLSVVLFLFDLWHTCTPYRKTRLVRMRTASMQIVLGIVALLLTGLISISTLLYIRITNGLQSGNNAALIATVLPSSQGQVLEAQSESLPTGMKLLTQVIVHIPQVLNIGFARLYELMPPAHLGVFTDASLIASCTILFLVIFLLLRLKYGLTIFATVSFIALVIPDVLMSKTVAPWIVSAAFVVCIIACWQSHWYNAHALLVASISVLSVVCMLLSTQAALDLAYRVPLRIDGQGLFSSSRVNPWIDLRASIVRQSGEHVLTYQAGHEVPLRLATLGDFNGETWSVEKDLSNSAGLYNPERGVFGSDLNLQTGTGNTDQNYTIVTENGDSYSYDADVMKIHTQLVDNGYTGISATTSQLVSKSPLLAAIELAWVNGKISINSPDALFFTDSGFASEYYNSTMGYLLGQNETYRYMGDNPHSETKENQDNNSTQSVIEHMPISASVTISNLNTRMLPIPGQLWSWNAPSGWFVYHDGTIVSESQQTRTNMSYRVNGIDIPTVRKASDTDTIAQIHEWVQNFYDEFEHEQNYHNQRFEIREMMAEIVGAQREGNWWIFDGKALDELGIPEGGESIFTQITELAADEVAYFLGFENPEERYIFVQAQNAQEYAQQHPEEMAQFGVDEHSRETLLEEAVHQQGLQILNRYQNSKTSSSMFSGSITGSATRSVAAIRDGFSREQARVQAAYGNLSQIMPDALHEQIRELQQQSRQAGVSNKPSTYREQLQVMKWLTDYFTNPQQHFTYSLQAPDGDGSNNMSVISNFLRTRSGYCTHYATALALLARAWSIPSRVVLGYTTGSDRTENGSYAVRVNQLHAWVEVWINDLGWVPFDTTPVANTQQSQKVDVAAANNNQRQEQEQQNVENAQNTSNTDTNNEELNTENQNATQPRTSKKKKYNVHDFTWKTPLEIILPTIAVLFLMTGIWYIPALVRKRRRRRLLGTREARTIRGKRAVDAWKEISNTCYDCGVRWSVSCDDIAIVDQVEKVLHLNQAGIGQCKQLAYEAQLAAFSTVHADAIDAPDNIDTSDDSNALDAADITDIPDVTDIVDTTETVNVSNNPTTTDTPDITVETCYQLIDQIYAADRNRSPLRALIHKHWPASLWLR